MPGKHLSLLFPFFLSLSPPSLHVLPRIPAATAASQAMENREAIVAVLRSSPSPLSALQVLRELKKRNLAPASAGRSAVNKALYALLSDAVEKIEPQDGSSAPLFALRRQEQQPHHQPQQQEQEQEQQEQHHHQPHQPHHQPQEQQPQHHHHHQSHSNPQSQPRQMHGQPEHHRDDGHRQLQSGRHDGRRAEAPEAAAHSHETGSAATAAPTSAKRSSAAASPLHEAVVASLRKSGRWTTSAELLAALKKDGVLAGDATKHELHRVLKELTQAAAVKYFKDAHFNAIPAYKSAHLERTAEDDLRELASEHGLELELNTEHVVHPHAAADDGSTAGGADRYRATVQLHGVYQRIDYDGVPRETAPLLLDVASSLKRYPDEAVVSACHEMLRRLALAKRLIHKGLKQRASRCFHLAYKRGHFWPRLDLYSPTTESWDLEFKGSGTDTDASWTVNKARKALKDHLNFFVFALNTWLMKRDADEEPVEDPKLVLGVHNNATMHGVQLVLYPSRLGCATAFKKHVHDVKEELGSMAIKSLTELCAPQLRWGECLTVECDQLSAEQRAVDDAHFYVLLTVVVDAARLLSSVAAGQRLGWRKKDGLDIKYRNGPYAVPCPPGSG